MNADYFAWEQFRDYAVLSDLANRERNAEFKAILGKLIQEEFEDYRFWLQFSRTKNFRVPKSTLLGYRLMRRMLGLTFTARFLERHERHMIKVYTEFAKTVDPALRKDIERIIAHEQEHEQTLISQIKEEKLEFLSNVILGLNDGLIEITGALAGFSMALQSARSTALAGLITGVAAILSMTASAYLQAAHEKGRNPKKAALYTGVAYAVVVVLLVVPFFFADAAAPALTAMLAVASAVILLISYYTSVLFARKFLRQCATMLALSLGVATVTFTLGFLFRVYYPQVPPL